jgi:tetratricopeptide (TPR) repeat protein
MELIDGVSITRYADDHRLDPRARLDLFLAVCQGVQHAHQKGIIHRDLKPSNVLVREADGAPIPKIIDFGIAKAIHETGDAPAATMVGLVMGTPEYMSPEQAGAFGASVDTRTDVYSLGVMLYELLTGSLPRRFTTHTPVEIQRVLAEGPPTRPSVVRRHLAGDLDNILLKAIAREPNDRYASVEQFADDVRRHLDGRPVLARQATWSYRSRKFVRRHRLGVAFAATVAVLAVGGAVAVVVQAARIAAERDRAVDAEQRAVKEAATARRVSEQMAGLFAGFDPYGANGQVDLAVAIRVIERGTARIRTELANDPEVQASLLHAMGVVARGLGLFVQATSLLQSALETRIRLFGERHADVASSHTELARALGEFGDDAAAGEHARKAVDIRRSLPPGSEIGLADNLAILGRSAYYQGRLDEAERLAAESLSICERLVGPADRCIGDALFVLAWVQSDRGHFEAGRRNADRLVEISRRAFGETHARTGDAVDLTGHTALHRGDYETAAAIWLGLFDLVRQAGYEDHSTMGYVHVSLARLRMEQGDFRGALRHTDDGLALNRKHAVPRVYNVMSARAIALHALGRLEEADRWFRDALATIQRDHPRNMADRVRMQWQYGLLLLDRDDVTRSEALLREAFAATRSVRPEGHPRAVRPALALAKWLMRAGKYEEAERLAIEGDRQLAALYGASHPVRIKVLGQIIELYEAWGRRDEAEKYRRARAAAESGG